MRKKKEVNKGSETYESKKATTCLCCGKKIKTGDTSFVVRSRDDGKVIARHCSEACNRHYMFFGPCGPEDMQPSLCPTPGELNDIKQDKLHELPDRWVTDEGTPE